MTSYPPPARFKMSDFNIGNFMFQPWIFRGCLSFQGCSWLMTGSLWRFTLCIFIIPVLMGYFFFGPLTSPQTTRHSGHRGIVVAPLTWHDHLTRWIFKPSTVHPQKRREWRGSCTIKRAPKLYVGIPSVENEVSHKKKSLPSTIAVVYFKKDPYIYIYIDVLWQNNPHNNMGGIGAYFIPYWSNPPPKKKTTTWQFFVTFLGL